MPTWSIFKDNIRTVVESLAYSDSFATRKLGQQLAIVLLLLIQVEFLASPPAPDGARFTYLWKPDLDLSPAPTPRHPLFTFFVFFSLFIFVFTTVLRKG